MYARKKSTNLLELIQTMEHVFQKQIPVNFFEGKQGDIKHSLGNSQNAGRLIGFQAETPLHEGLRAMLIN